MRTAILIQARMGSTRLPGKVLMDLGGVTMLERVVTRASRSRLADLTVVVTTDEAADGAIVDLCQAREFFVFRGSENDVLDRYYRAAVAFEAEVIVRITADCPFIDPQVVDLVIEALGEAAADYASNTLKRTFPHGLDVEVFTFEALSEAAQRSKSDHERMHVTPYIYQRPERFKLHNVRAEADYAHFRWTVDEARDYALAKALYEALGNEDGSDWQTIVRVMLEKPELTTINQDVRQKGLYEG